MYRNLFIIITLIFFPSLCVAEEDEAPLHLQASEVLAAAAAPAPAADGIVFQALALLGVGYRHGGRLPSTGLDCSGLVRYVFREVQGVELPTTSRELAEIGEKVPRDALQPGDLVFYNTLRRAFSHVGIYLGENRFIHAPSSGGEVRIDDMTTEYWVKRFNGARRIAGSPLPH